MSGSPCHPGPRPPPPPPAPRGSFSNHLTDVWPLGSHLKPLSLLSPHLTCSFHDWLLCILRGPHPDPQSRSLIPLCTHTIYLLMHLHVPASSRMSVPFRWVSDFSQGCLCPERKGSHGSGQRTLAGWWPGGGQGLRGCSAPAPENWPLLASLTQPQQDTGPRQVLPSLSPQPHAWLGLWPLALNLSTSLHPCLHPRHHVITGCRSLLLALPAPLTCFPRGRTSQLFKIEFGIPRMPKPFNVLKLL